MLLKDFGIRKEAEKPLVCLQDLGFVGAAMSVTTTAVVTKEEYLFNVVGLDLDNDPVAVVSLRLTKVLSLSLVISRCISKRLF